MRIIRYFVLLMLLIYQLVFSLACNNAQTIVQIDESMIRASVVILNDLSLSTKGDKVSRLGTSDIKRLPQTLLVGGGEIAYGTIDSDSDAAFHRLKIQKPPSAPATPSNKNPLMRMTERKAYEELRASFEVAFEEWEKRTYKDLEEWLAEIEPELKREPYSKETDFIGAVNRSVQILQEPEKESAKKFLLIVSDCRNDTRRKSELRPIPEDVKLLTVTDAENSDALKEFSPSNFSSARSAVDYIINQINSQLHRRSGDER